MPSETAGPSRTGCNEGAIAPADKKRHREVVYNLLALFGAYLAEAVVAFRTASRHGRFWPYSISSRVLAEMAMHKSVRVR